jgi:hypothetical protein
MSRKGRRGKKPKPPAHEDSVGQALDIVENTIPAEEAEHYNHNDKHDGSNVLRVHVATPAYDGKVDCDYASSMLMAGQICSLQLIETSSAVLGNGAFIEIARNVLVKEFLEAERLKEFTHFMFIDGDLRFESRAMAGLVRSGLPVSCGAYRRRQDEVSYPVRWTPMPKDDDREPDRLWMNGGWVRCDRVPTGFLCIERGVLEEMTRRAIAGEFPYNTRSVIDLPDKGPTPWLFYTKIDEHGRFVGEDFCWSDDYMALYEEGVFDEPIWCWADFDFVHGGYQCNWLEHLDATADKKYKPNKRRLGRRGKA